MAEAVQVIEPGAETVQEGVPDGYRLTEIGLIPSDWQFKPLGKVISLQRGHDLTARQRGQGDVPVMGSAGQNGFHDTALVEGPGVVLGRSGASYGQAHYCQTSFWPHNTALYVTDFRGSDPLFVFYFLRSIDFSRHNSGGAQQSLNRNFIYPIPVAVPNPNEQKVIAQAISDADALITSLKQLIEKKRLIKQGAMQELLSGRKRLPGFDRPWRNAKFGALASLRKERLDPRIAGRQAFCVELEHVEQATGRLQGFAEAIENSSLKGVFQEGDVLFGKLRGYLRKYWLADRSGVCSTEFWVLAPVSDLTTSAYLYQLVQTDAFIEVASLGYGTHMPRSDWASVKEIEFPIPDINEQEAIGHALDDMDAELAALDARLTKASQIKQGMMQELLTGRVRLV